MTSDTSDTLHAWTSMSYLGPSLTSMVHGQDLILVPRKLLRAKRLTAVSLELHVALTAALLAQRPNKYDEHDDENDDEPHGHQLQSELMTV